MSVLVDTSILSLALRRSPRHLGVRERQAVFEWERLLSAGQAWLAGPIRQEILSGIRDVTAFDTVRKRLDAFDYVELSLIDYDQAAYFSNTLQSSGIAAAPVDMLICALAYRWQLKVFTTDRDFDRFANYLPIEMHTFG